MRCREARKKLNMLADGLLDGDEEQAIREHLSKCPRCSRLALAEKLMATDIEQLRQAQTSHPITIQQAREGIAIREKNLKNMNLGARIMRQISDSVYKKPRLSLAAAALFILLLASVLVPVTTEHPVGYEVAFAAPAGDLVLNEENAEKMLAVLDINDASIIALNSESGVEYRIAPLEDSVKAHKLVMILDSLGGKQVRSMAASTKSKNQTILQILIDKDELETDSSILDVHTGKNAGTVDINTIEIFKDDFILWIQSDDQPGDSLQGILMEGKGKKKNIRLIGMNIPPDKCGWNQYLNNSSLNTTTPEGKEETFKLYELEDVRRLEKMGYNFVTTKFEPPPQIPIPGMGPRLNDIKANQSAKETIIEYMIPQADMVRIQILDESGLEICTLLDCMPVGGIHHVTWDGSDDSGHPVMPGSYICKFTAGDYAETKEIRLTH